MLLNLKKINYLIIIVFLFYTSALPALERADALIGVMQDIEEVTEWNIDDAYRFVDEAGTFLTTEGYDEAVLRNTFILLIKIRAVDANYFIYESIEPVYDKKPKWFMKTLKDTDLTDEEQAFILENIQTARRVRLHGNG